MRAASVAVVDGIARTAAWHDAHDGRPRGTVDAIAGFGLFADLTAPQLEGDRPHLRGALFAEGERVLRQGLTGSGFYVILDGEAAVVVDGAERATLGPRRLLRRGVDPPGRAAHRRLVATRPLRCLVLAGPRVEAFLVAHPRVMYRMLQAQARRLRAANRWRS